jgi:ribosomal protein L12E/L44/L45/RPP1/RPP2
MEWVRLYHDMPSDPKWRVIAKKSGQRIGDVIAVYAFMLTNASGNAVKRGVTQGFVTEDVAAAIDLEEAGVTAILDAMEGKVVKSGMLLGWEKRNPVREDSSTDRVRKHRETQRNAMKRPDKTREEQSREEDLESKGAPQAALPAKLVRKSTTALPANFPAAEDMRLACAYWAERDRADLAVTVDDEAQRFIAHHTAHGKRMADWGQAWVTWYSNAIKFNRKPKNGTGPTAHENFALGAYLAGDADPH